jgi:hypothetical protein
MKGFKMKKIAYLISAISAGLYSSAAVADISVSGTGSIAYTDAGGNTSTTYGGGISFALSTTTDAGVSVTASSAISNDNDSVNSSSSSTGVTALTFGFANGSITVGGDVGVSDGVGLVGELAHYNDNQTSITNKPGIGDDEGDGIAVSTSVGDISIALQYVWDGNDGGDVDGATTTSQGGSLSMPVAGGTLTIASASDDVNGTNMTETAAKYVMAVGDGTLSLGLTGTDGDTAAKEGESMSAAYSTTMGGVAVGLGYTAHDANNKNAQQTDITLSSALGGGVSIFAEYSNVSGTVAAETASLSNNTVAIGTSVSF